MTQLDLFGAPVAPADPPRPTPLGGFLRAVYTRYDPKAPSRCDYCVIALHETWRDGMTSFAPARTARVRRVQGDEVLLLCNEHAEELKKEEK